MILLWILLWILAILLLLLCLPLTLRVSWWYPPQGKRIVEHRSYLTQSVQEEMEQLELCEEDKQVLRQMIGGLPPQELPPDKELNISLHWLFLHFSLYPMKKKPPKPRKEKKEKPAKEPASEKVSNKEEKLDWKGLLPQLWECAKKPMQMALGNICLHHLQLSVLYAGEDTAEAALGAQKLVIAVYTLLGVAQNHIRVKKADIRIQPDFSDQEDGDWTTRFRVSIHPMVWLGAGLWFLGCFAKKLLRQQLDKQKNEKKRKKDSTDSKFNCGKQTEEQQVSA